MKTLELSGMFDALSAYRRLEIGCNPERADGTAACRLIAARAETVVGQPAVCARCKWLKLDCLNSSSCDSCRDGSVERLKRCLEMCGGPGFAATLVDSKTAIGSSQRAFNEKVTERTENLTAPDLSYVIITGSPKLAGKETSHQYGDGVPIVPNVLAQQPGQLVTNPTYPGGIRCQ